jgi:general secretion pathway protein G
MSKSARAVARGFTLIELMVVIVILGALVALVGPNVWNALVGSTRKTVEVQIDNFNKAINLYYLDKRSLPSTLEDLSSPSQNSSEPYMRPIPSDPWGEAYEYMVVNASKREYTIASNGEDKTAGTDDDIRWSSTEGFGK